MKSHSIKLFAVVLVFTMLMAACSGQTAENQPSLPEDSPDTTGAEIITPSITVNDQDASEGTVTIANVQAADSGWVVIHTKVEGAPGPVIGFASVAAGENLDVEVEIDLSQATAELIAMLHLDAGVAGEYEFPGDDVPVKNGDAVVIAPFSVTLPAFSPSVSVSDQEAGNGSVTIDEVVAADPGWLVIHITLNGKPGPVIGYAQVEAGINQNLVVDIDQEQATPQLFAMLHLDAGVAGEYEFPGDDVPVKNGDAVVNVPFNLGIDFQQAVTANDQETSGVVTIAEIRSAQPGWMVIHADNDGAPGPVVGYAPVAVGLNTDLAVEIDLEQATDRLYAMLHVDAGTMGEYEFPGDDVPVKVGDAVLVVPFNITKAEASAPVIITIQGSAFSEANLSVPVGTTVVWMQQDSIPHTVTADDGSFKSDTLQDGDTFEFTFTEVGTFPYHCEFHGGSGGSGMAATITVTQ